MNDQTRRDWVVAITRATAGFGIAWRVQGATVQPLSLPPGVYLPSGDDLGHALMSADRFHPIPPGCPTDYVRPTTGPYQPLFFSRPHFSMVRRLTELLLGEPTDSAVSREVAEWIDLAVSTKKGVQTAEEQLDPQYRALAVAYFGPAHSRGPERNSTAVCREGLEWISQTAQARYANEFLALGVEEQLAILTSIGDGQPGEQNENPGTRLFTLLKTETINGFYTSRVGLHELNFKGNAFYASSPGCHAK
jgi:hypothetical protein